MGFFGLPCEYMRDGLGVTPRGRRLRVIAAVGELPNPPVADMPIAETPSYRHPLGTVDSPSSVRK
jgi:hypothetical protein